MPYEEYILPPDAYDMAGIPAAGIPFKKITEYPPATPKIEPERVHSSIEEAWRGDWNSDSDYFTAYDITGRLLPYKVDESLPDSVNIPPDYKYNEEIIQEEIANYIKTTYSQHYVGKDNIQSLDLIFASGHGEGFCIGNILKLAARYGKKEGKNRKDLLKIVHYAILAMYLNDKEKNKKNDLNKANNPK